MNHMYTEQQLNMHHSHSEYTLLEFAVKMLEKSSKIFHQMVV